MAARLTGSKCALAPALHQSVRSRSERDDDGQQHDGRARDALIHEGRESLGLVHNSNDAARAWLIVRLLGWPFQTARQGKGVTQSEQRRPDCQVEGSKTGRTSSVRLMKSVLCHVETVKECQDALIQTRGETVAGCSAVKPSRAWA